MNRDSDQNAQDTLAELETAQALRGHYESVWEQIADRVMPSYSKQFTGQNRASMVPGTQHMAEMVDSTAALALSRFAAAMESMLTPRNSTWHSVIPSDEYLMRDRETRLWFEDLTRMLFRLRYAPTANFASQKHEDYMMLGAFGTGNIFIDALQSQHDKGLRYRAVHLGQTYFMENHQGLIDQVYRKFPLTARQAIQQFGETALPDVILKDAEGSRSGTKEHTFVHKVSPRDEAKYDPERKDLDGMPFYSCYVSQTGKVTVKESGYHTFPYAISRYVMGPGELYGRSPAMMALPTIKTLNEMKKTILKQGHRTVDPVLLAHDDGILDSFSLKPGALNPGGVNAEGKPLVHALPTGNLAVGDKLMDAEKLVINDFFLVTLFQILVETPQMTATEVIERAREKGALISPTMGRQQSESLGPMVMREIDLLTQLKLLRPMPQALLEAKGEYSIQYDSPLSRMARAEEASGFMRMHDFSAAVFAVTQDPRLFDYYDYDVAIPKLADTHAVPVSWLNNTQKIKALRDGRAQQAQQAQMAEMAPAASNVLKTLMPKPPQAAGTA